MPAIPMTRGAKTPMNESKMKPSTKAPSVFLDALSAPHGSHFAIYDPLSDYRAYFHVSSGIALRLAYCHKGTVGNPSDGGSMESSMREINLASAEFNHLPNIGG